MNILFTGGSSFTGFWFIQELASAGHAVTAVLRKSPEEYHDELRRTRTSMLARSCRLVVGCSFGDDAFLRLIGEGRWDLLCHHAADVSSYKSPDFDVVSALSSNTWNLSNVLESLKQAGCHRVLLTGSFFEGGEGAGSQGLPHLLPYGLSKALTDQVFRFYCERAGMSLGKFVIPNPFGPYEEPRFTAYLIKNWLAGGTPSCASPTYVRDNIAVSLLARAYCRFAEALESAPGLRKSNPSGYVESQGAFALRVAREMEPRLRVPCPVELKQQVEFPEPRIRINTDVADDGTLNWNEARAWDDMAAFYERYRAGMA